MLKQGSEYETFAQDCSAASPTGAQRFRSEDFYFPVSIKALFEGLDVFTTSVRTRTTSEYV